MKKTAETRFPLHDLIAERWSPRAFADRPVEAQVVGSLLEAARWAPSAFNEQPWRFFVAHRAHADDHRRLSECLVEGNAWAREAPLLVLTVANTSFTRNGKPNAHARHDVGLATMSLVLQAQAEGLVSHQMAGFDPQRARTSLGIPDGFEPVAMVAIGYPGDEDRLPEALREREAAPRGRHELEAMVFGAGWDQPFDLGR